MNPLRSVRKKLRDHYDVLGHPWRNRFAALSSAEQKRVLEIAKTGASVKQTGDRLTIISCTLLVAGALATSVNLIVMAMLIVIGTCALTVSVQIVKIGKEIRGRHKHWERKGYYTPVTHRTQG